MDARTELTLSFWRVWTSLLLAGIVLLGGSGHQIQAVASAPGQPMFGALPESAAQEFSGETLEIDDLLVVPIESTSSPSAVMRSRPFILDWGTNPAFAWDTGNLTPLDELSARGELDRFLRMRDVNATDVAAALTLYDNISTQAIIQSPSLRAALLMLYAWDPYQVVVDSILFGENDTTQPFASVGFAHMAYPNAVATIGLDYGFSPPRYRLSISAAFAAEPPLQLAPALIHESLHGDGVNSAEEELVANILDTIAYAELLLVDSSSALSRTQLTVYNNMQLYALLNSMGARGAGHLGIVTSVSGDVFVGPGLADFNAHSLRASIMQDEFYRSLSAGGSAAPGTTLRLVERFTGISSRTGDVMYNEQLLALIDLGVGRVLPPQSVHTLAMALGLRMTIGSSEQLGSPILNRNDLLGQRPFLPMKPGLFNMNRARRASNPTGIDQVRARLQVSLEAQVDSTGLIVEQLGWFDDPEIIARFPDSQIRAALILLGSIDTWSESLLSTDTLLRQSAWTIAFASIPAPINASFSAIGPGGSELRLNEMLSGDSLEVIAAAIVEGLLLEENYQSPNATIVAALLSTICYGDLVAHNPEIVNAPTWGTISRNLDLLALLNSAQWSVTNTGAGATSIGFLSSGAGIPDVLPGALLDATSFHDYVSQSARFEGVSNVVATAAPELLVNLAGTIGVVIESGPAGPVITSMTLQRLDLAVGILLPNPRIAEIVSGLSLGVAA